MLIYKNAYQKSDSEVMVQAENSEEWFVLY